MSQFEKPLIRGSTAPEVTVGNSDPRSINDHRSDLFFTAIETTRMPMLVTNPREHDNPILFANRAFYSMTGYTPSEVLGHNCRFLQGPDTDRATVADIREAINAIREINVEVLNYRKDGSSFWNALFISPVFSSQGELVFFFASQLDVSRRRDAEHALAQAQKMEALGQLTGGIAHDFNNLLQLMSGHMEILNRRLQQGQFDRQVLLQSVERSKSAIAKASTLTQQLLAFSRRQQLHGRPVNLNSLTVGITEIAKQTLGNGVIVRAVLEPQLANCRLDPSQFDAALLNILVNARDAMEGGGEVTISTRNANVDSEDVGRMSGLVSGQYVCIAVSDTGSGIPAELIKHVTEPFFTTKGEGKGTGLGLSMVFGFAKQSGGSMEIESQVGIGTTVRLYFPATEEVSRPPGTLGVALTDRGGSERVLVVDDRTEVAELAREMLEGLGYVAHIETDPQDALNWLARQPADALPALLFSDVIMPGSINGYVLAKEVRRRHPAMRVLLTTGFAGDPVARTGEDEIEVLHKPYRLHDLAVKVRMVLDDATGASRSERRLRDVE